MPENFELALYSILIISASGVLSIALARLARVHPAFFFIAAGVITGIYMPFTLPSASLLIQLAPLGALFVIFLSALEIEWDLRFAWKFENILTSLLLQITTAIPVALFFYWVLRSDILTAATAGFIAAVHAPERKPALVSESFRNNKVTGELAFMGFISEITALLAVSLIVAYTQRQTITGDLLQTAVGALLIMLILISVMPQALRFLLRRVGEESYALYYLMLVLLVTVILFVRKAGIEPLLGAYAAGFVLTRFVTEGSKVLERLRFTGHSIIVPAFYIQIGMSSNLVMELGFSNIFAALALLLLTIAFKSVFAVFLRVRRKPARFPFSQLLRKNPLVLVLIYIAHARGVLSTSAMHTLLIYSIFNEILLAVLSRKEKRQSIFEPQTGEASRILLPVSNPETMLPLFQLAAHLGGETGPAKIFPLNVVPDGPGTEERIRAVETQFNELIPLYALREQNIELTARIENDRIKAVAHAARELLTDKILVGLGVIPTLQRPQGYSFLESLTVSATTTTIIAAHIQTDLALTNSLNVIIASSRLITSCETWLPAVLRLAERLKADPVFFGEPTLLPELQQKLSDLNYRRKFALRAGHIHAGLDLLTLDGNENALAIAVLERAAFFPEEKIHARLPEMMLRAYADRNFMLIYPAGHAPQTRGKKAGTAWRKLRRFLGFS